MITNQQAIRFTNENARVIANLLCTLDRTLDRFALNVVRDFEAFTGGDQNADVIADGAAENGTNAVTKQNIAELKYVCEQVKAALNQDDRAAIVNRFVTGGLPKF